MSHLHTEYDGIVISVLIGIAWMENSISGGILIAIIGSGISWIGSFFAYGFGELIEKTSEIATNISCFNNGPKLGSDGERHRSLHHIDDEDYDEHGVYKPVDHSKDAAKPAEENGGEKKNAALPKGAVPLKEDAPVREKKDTKKAEEPKEESVAEEAAQTDEENK